MNKEQLIAAWLQMDCAEKQFPPRRGLAVEHQRQGEGNLGRSRGHDRRSRQPEAEGSLELSRTCCFDHIGTPCGRVILVSLYCLLLGGLAVGSLAFPKAHTAGGLRNID